MNFQKRIIRISVLMLLSAWVISCSFEKHTVRSSESAEHNPVREEIIQDARHAIGAGYGYGSTGTRRYDCSGLVYSLYTAQDIGIPRSTREMAHFGEKIKKEDLQPGDVVFFRNVRKIDHVAIVSRTSPSKTWLIHSTTSQGVVEDILEESPYWNKRIDQYRRFIH